MDLSVIMDYNGVEVAPVEVPEPATLLGIGEDPIHTRVGRALG